MLVHVVVLVVFLKSVDRLQGYDLLCGQLMTTLVSASSKRSSATGGLHSCAETVYFASLSFLGLIRSFHVFFSFHCRGGHFAGEATAFGFKVYH